MSHPFIQVFGEPIEILVSSKSTNYTFCAAIQHSPPGGGPPPHMHERKDEFFLVLEGQFELFTGEIWRPLATGESAFAPRGRFHGFRNSGPTPGRMLFTTNGGALDEYFAAISPLVLPHDLDRLTDISRHYGLVFLPPA